jgi:hypothetical protein
MWSVPGETMRAARLVYKSPVGPKVDLFLDLHWFVGSPSLGLLVAIGATRFQGYGITHDCYYNTLLSELWTPG